MRDELDVGYHIGELDVGYHINELDVSYHREESPEEERYMKSRSISRVVLDEWKFLQ